MIRVVTENESRVYGSSEIPLAIGIARNGTVVFGESAERSPAVWVRTHEERVYIQPESRSYKVTHNDDPVTGPIWLQPGDRVVIGKATISIGDNEGMLVFSSGVAATKAAPPPIVPDDPQSAPAAEPEPSRVSTPVPTEGPGVAAVPPHAWRSRGFRRGAILIFAAFVVLALGVGFVLTAGPVRISILPNPQSMSFSGTLPPIPIGDRYLAFPGIYTITADAPGYHRLEENLEVEFGTKYDLVYQMNKLPGLLDVAVRPETPAAIFVDDKPVGSAPLKSFTIEAGEHEIKAVADRYLPAIRTIEIRGMGETQAVSFELRPGWGTLKVDSVPPQAAVKLDGQLVGETPVALEPMQGEHEVTVEKEGWKPATLTVAIKAGETVAPPPFKLERVDGVLNVSSEPAGATVVVDGAFRGRTPVSFSLVSGKQYEVKVTKPGYGAFSKVVGIDGDARNRIDARLVPELGTVFIRTRPSGAKLYVDGRLVGAASRRLRLTTAPHQIKITKPGYEDFSTTVTPRKGISRTLDVQLKKPVEVAREKAEQGSKATVGNAMRLIAIERPVRFTMGASRREAGRRSNETQYAVELTRSFMIAAKEVTNAEFRRYRAQHSSGSERGISLNGPQLPVVSVSWDNAARYANWLSKKEGLPPVYREESGKMVAVDPITTGYRLPTEAEWAFAARYDGGRIPSKNPLKYPWGKSMPPAANSGNFADKSASGRLPFAIRGYTDKYPVAAPVGQFSPNKSGVYDLGGNVAEWCHDYYDTTIGSAQGVRRDPTGPKRGTFHVVRGASWRHGTITELRLSFRDYAKAPRNDLGFRIARYVDKPK